MATYTNAVSAPKSSLHEDPHVTKWGKFKGRRDGRLLDSHWLRRSFLVESDKLTDEFLELRTASSSKFKYTNSSPGGSLVLNPLPQASILTDPPPIKHRVGDKTYSISSFGHYYSTAFDDNMQVITMRFGVPAFNSLFRFLNGMYDYRAGKYARTGRGAGIIYNVVRGTMSFATSLLFWPIKALSLIDKGARYFLDKPSSKFYYLKPTMPMYWDTVQTIVNHLAANTGLIFYDSPVTTSSTITEDNYSLTPQDRAALHRMYPEIISEDGHIDIYALANRGQRAWRRSMNQMIKAGLVDYDSVATKASMKWDEWLDTAPKALVNEPKFKDYFQQWINNPASQAADSAANTVADLDMADDPNSYGPIGLGEFFRANMENGGDWISFRVNAGGSVSESFSNDFKSSQIGDKINSMGTTMRDISFDLAQGNIGDGMLAQLGEGLMSIVRDVGQAAIDTINLNGLAVLGGAAFADFPQHWDKSTASLPTASYQIDIPMAQNDPISRLMTAFVPLSCALAAVLPRSAGLNSHVEPFLCEIYDRGRQQTRLGMVKSLSITRGTGNVGWNAKGQWLGLQISMEVMDLSQILVLPVSEAVGWGDVLGSAIPAAAAGAVLGSAAGPVGTAGGAGLGAALGASSEILKGVFDDDNYFNDYMAILSSLGMSSQINRLDKLKRRLTIKLANAERLTSKAYVATHVTDNMLGHALSSLFFYGNHNMNQQ